MPSQPPPSQPRSPAPSNTRRLPLSLRRPPASRKPSNPHLSLIFADPSLTHGGQASRPGSLASEDALSKQLDAGGQAMGLRSRRSSSATVATLRTYSGGEEGVREDEEENEAGPSTPRSRNTRGDGVSERGTERDSDGDRSGTTEQAVLGGTVRRLNPKESSSWLRWNAPIGFPRSRAGSIASKGKGKEREVDEMIGSRPSSLRPPSNIGHLDRSSSAPPDMDLSVPASTELAIERIAPDPLPPDPVPETTLRPPAINAQAQSWTPRRNWWSRTATPMPRPQAKAQIVPAQPPDSTTIAQEADSKLAGDTIGNTGDGSGMDTGVVAPDASAPKAALPAEPTVSDDSPGIDTAAPESGDTTVRPTQPLSSGWRSYIWGTAPVPTDDTKVVIMKEDIVESPGVSATDVPSAASSTSSPSKDLAEAVQPQPPSLDDDIIEAQNDPSLPAVGVGAPSDDAQSASPIAQYAQQGSSGWGTFLYSLVIPQIAAARSIEADLPAETNQVHAGSKILVSPTEDQRPLPTSTSQPDLPPTESAHDIAPNENLKPGGTPDLAPVRRSSAASTTGWLSYLAYRSTQKRVTAQSTTGSIRSSGGRPSMEVEEEVMDFSTDPDFPATSTAPNPSSVDKSSKTSKDSDTAKMPPPKSIPAKSSTFNIRGKRLSVSSTRSGGSLTPLSSSPKTVNPLDVSSKTLGPSAKPSTTSSLPPQPHVPAIQPNLVIPTFRATFDRPPRSLPPVPRAPPEPVNTTSTTSSLAWRALSVAGSYVYPTSTAPEKGKAKVPEEKEENGDIRGKKEGRDVGGDLPRRCGLLGGDEEEGWQNVKRVVVVGVHGWFPAKMLNSVIGEPTGTSQKFASMMGAAVKQFFDDKGVDALRLTLMPLEGEGTIESRVDKLYKAYLSNPAWINDLRRADAIFFAAHSQGCIVTTHLLSRMIAQGHIRTPLNVEAVARCEWAFGPIGLLPPDPRRLPHIRQNTPGNEGGYQKVALLAMCGVHLGPLYSISTSTVIQPYLQWFENAAARELFEFQETGSAVSVAYQKALGMVLENEVKVILLASLNDQVVPIYGASFSTANHPLLLRALFVDGASYSQTDFMTNLLCFAFMLRNAGLDDQRLIEHLSEATAGSLTGVGHSTPYEEPQSYALAVQYLFLSGPARQPIPALHVEPFSARDSRNEYELPWIMRALVDSPEVKDLFPGELRDLKEGVIRWRPITKVLKEVKRRLEPMAGRQSKMRLSNSPSSLSVDSLGDPAIVGSVGKGKEGAIGMGLRRDW